MTKVIDLLNLLENDNSLEEKDAVLTRKLCAKIIHEFLQKNMHEPDEIGIEKAYFIRDLFDCRVCANHIAQVYLKGIMDVFSIDKDLVLFMPEKEVSDEQLREYVKRTVDRSKREKH